MRGDTQSKRNRAEPFDCDRHVGWLAQDVVARTPHSCNGSWGDSAKLNARFRTDAEALLEGFPNTSAHRDGGIAEKEAATTSHH
jgi:hypothetical protein